MMVIVHDHNGDDHDDHDDEDDNDDTLIIITWSMLSSLSFLYTFQSKR